MSSVRFPKIAQFRDAQALRDRLAELGLDVPVDDQLLTADQGSPLAQPLRIGRLQAGNRWCVHPMEGWDGQRDGSPSELTTRRWRNFGRSGAKLIWGGEAAAVRHDGRANPRQLIASPRHRDGLARLLDALRQTHRERHGGDDDLVVGLQLTHSGRFARPDGPNLAPRLAYHHPLLDPHFGIDPNDDSLILSDDELDRLLDDYVAAAEAARDAGFQFVDLKACHGYLVHELLGAQTRPGKYGGDLQGRSRFLLTLVGRVRQACPELEIGVRMSVFDTPPFTKRGDVGAPVEHRHCLPYRYGFGVDPEDPLKWNPDEPLWVISQLQNAGVAAINVSGASPYYNPHCLRPAMYPPSDGYPPPEDPLVGVARHIQAARRCKEAVPNLPMVGSGYTYLQEYLPQVAQAVVRRGWIDAVGVGRMILAYPDFPHDALVRGRLDRKRICRTFSDCTTGPRNGMVSGCYPLDPFYKARPEAQRIKEIRRKSGTEPEA